MDMKELIERIVDQSKDERVGAGSRRAIVETLLEDVEDWPAWYYELFEGERNYDLSGKVPSALQKLNLKTMVGAVKGIVTEYAPDLKKKRGFVVNVDSVALSVAERIVYWEDWYWDMAGGYEAGREYQDDDDRMRAYADPYGIETRYGTE